ncbi:MAG: Ig-like domain-containing protein [Nitrospira sp.]|nr:Ig-like domain-containing protein [Nitrospira sp.]
MITRAKKFWTIAATLSFALTLAACGGDDGGGPPPPRTGDSTPPTVSSISPANGATGVAVNAALTATFSEQMDPTTITIATFTVKDAANNPAMGTVSYSGTTTTFTPSANLASSTTYTATITTGVTDLAGNHLIGAYSWNFTTGVAPDTTPPSVISTNPASGTSGVGVTANITAAFSEAIAPSTINASSFLLKDSGNNPITGTASYSGNTATFSPGANLAFSTSYTATITTAVTDVVGNALASNYSWTFVTAAAPTFMTVIKSGTGTGTVTSTPAGINCGPDCTEEYSNGTQVTLTAIPNAGSVFDGFGGSCGSIKTTCTVTVAGNATVTATFNNASVSAADTQLGLNGTDDVAVHQPGSNPPSSALDLTAFTIEAWVYPLADKDMIVVADSAYYLMVKPQPLRVEFAVMTSTGSPAFLSFAGTTNPLKLNQWNHVVGMANNFTKTLQVAVNGELSGSLTIPGNVAVGFPQTFSVGNSYPRSLGDYPFIGRIDEVRLSSVLRYSGSFNPTALLDPDGSTVGLWHFDEAEGAKSFADSSGNGNTLAGLGGASTIAGTREVPETKSNFFYSLVKLNTGQTSGPVAIGDLNHDSHQDLAVVGVFAIASGNAVTFFGSGTSSFGAPSYVNLGVAGAHSSIALIDFNKDGHLDIVASNFIASSISIVLGTGTGTFESPIIASVGNNPSTVEAGDFNKDGKLDLVVANTSSNTISLLLGIGTGAVGPAINFAVGVSPISVVRGDFNGDGNLDIAVANRGTCCSYVDSSVSILLGDGTGTLILADNIALAGQLSDLVGGDFNMDGKLDLAVGKFGKVFIFLGTGTGVFNLIGDFTGPSSYMAIGDLNQDGILDLAGAGGIILGEGTGSFNPYVPFDWQNLLSLEIADLNGDGKPELVTGVGGDVHVHFHR